MTSRRRVDRLRLRCAQRHGIFRDIPTRFVYEPDPAFDRVYPFEVDLGRRIARHTRRVRGGGCGRGRDEDQDRRPGPHHQRASHLRDRVPRRGRAERVRDPRRAVLERDRRRVGGADRRCDRERSRLPPRSWRLSASTGRRVRVSSASARRSRRRGPFPGGQLQPYPRADGGGGHPEGLVPEPGAGPGGTLVVRDAPTASMLHGLPGRLALLVVGVVGGLSWLGWSRGRDRRYRGSPVDQVMGGDPARLTRPCRSSRATRRAPVEFAPPGGPPTRPDRDPARRAGEHARRHGHDRRPRGQRSPLDPGDPEGRAGSARRTGR